jgi:hypothetical protein
MADWAPSVQIDHLNSSQMRLHSLLHFLYTSSQSSGDLSANSIINPFEGKITEKEAEPRPDTLEIKESIGFLGSTLDNAKTSLQKAETKTRSELETCEKKILDIMMEIKRLESAKEEDYVSITKPAQSAHYQQVPLCDKEIERLKKMRTELEKSYFLDIMKKIGREDSYHWNSVGKIASLDSITDFMVNYVPFPETKLNHGVIDILQRRGLVFIDKSGNARYDDGKLASLLTIISTNEKNIEEAWLRGAQVAKTGRKFANNVTMRSQYNKAWRYRFAIHSFMPGLKPWAPSPTLPSRLKELEWMEAAYNQKQGSESILEHHSLFLGEWTVFEELTGVRYVAGNHEETLRRIGEFWKNYNIIDPEARLERVSLIVAEIIYGLNQFSSYIESAIADLEEVNTRRIIDSGELIEHSPSLELLNVNLRKVSERIQGFKGRFKKLEEASRKTKADVKELKIYNEEKQEKVSTLLTMDFNAAYDETLFRINKLKELLPSRQTADKLSKETDDVLTIMSNLKSSIEGMEKFVSRKKRR